MMYKFLPNIKKWKDLHYLLSMWEHFYESCQIFDHVTVTMLSLVPPMTLPVLLQILQDGFRLSPKCCLG